MAFEVRRHGYRVVHQPFAQALHLESATYAGTGAAAASDGTASVATPASLRLRKRRLMERARASFVNKWSQTLTHHETKFTPPKGQPPYGQDDAFLAATRLATRRVLLIVSRASSAGGSAPGSGGTETSGGSAPGRGGTEARARGSAPGNSERRRNDDQAPPWLDLARVLLATRAHVSMVFADAGSGQSPPPTDPLLIARLRWMGVEVLTPAQVRSVARQYFPRARWRAYPNLLTHPPPSKAGAPPTRSQPPPRPRHPRPRALTRLAASAWPHAGRQKEGEGGGNGRCTRSACGAL